MITDQQEGGVKMSSTPTSFSLLELSARKKKTQRQGASDLGISLTTYNSWEKDISRVAVSKVQAVADYFGVPLAAISFAPEHENNSCTK